MGWALKNIASLHDHAALLGTRHDGNGAICGNCFGGRAEILGLVKRLYFGFVGKDDVNIVANEVEEAVTVPFNAKGI